jgi:hypothetical protein
MDTIARHVEMPSPPAGSPGLFRCAPEGMMVETFREAGLLDVAEEEVSTMMVHDAPERYWDFMAEIAAPVVAGLSRADTATREKIRREVLELALQFVSDGKVHLRSTATVIIGTR